MPIEIIFYNKDKKTNQSLKLVVPSNCFYRMASTDESTFVVKNRTDEIVSLPKNQVFELSVGYLSSQESPTLEDRINFYNFYSTLDINNIYYITLNAIDDKGQINCILDSKKFDFTIYDLELYDNQNNDNGTIQLYFHIILYKSQKQEDRNGNTV